MNAQGVYQIAPVIQDVAPWTDMVALYERLRDDPGGMMGVVFGWR